jgi:hypothetical protein
MDLVFTISLKRSTQNLQLSTSWAGRLHHLLSASQTQVRHRIESEKCHEPTRALKFCTNYDGYCHRLAFTQKGLEQQGHYPIWHS